MGECKSCGEQWNGSPQKCPRCDHVVQPKVLPSLQPFDQQFDIGDPTLMNTVPMPPPPIFQPITSPLMSLSTPVDPDGATPPPLEDERGDDPIYEGVPFGIDQTLPRGSFTEDLHSSSEERPVMTNEDNVLMEIDSMGLSNTGDQFEAISNSPPTIQGIPNQAEMIGEFTVDSHLDDLDEVQDFDDFDDMNQKTQIEGLNTLQSSLQKSKSSSTLISPISAHESRTETGLPSSALSASLASSGEGLRQNFKAQVTPPNRISNEEIAPLPMHNKGSASFTSKLNEEALNKKFKNKLVEPRLIAYTPHPTSYSLKNQLVIGESSFAEGLKLASEHFKVTADQEHFWIEDMSDSHQGVWLLINTPTPLSIDDVLLIGKTRICVASQADLFMETTSHTLYSPLPTTGYTLLVLDHEGTIQQIVPLKEGVTTIGRMNVDLALNDPSVDMKHAALSVRGSLIEAYNIRGESGLWRRLQPRERLGVDAIFCAGEVLFKLSSARI